MSNKRKFVVSQGDQQSGPFDETELQAQWHRGDLRPIDYVYDDEKQDWIMVAERFEWAGLKKEIKSPTAPSTSAVTDTPPALSEDSVRRRGAVVRRSAIQADKSAATKTQISKANAAPTEAGHPVSLKNGFAEIELPADLPGQLELLIQNSSTPLKVQGPLRIAVKAAQPVEIRWNLKDSETVGVDFEIVAQALDEMGKVCITHNYDYVLKIDDSARASTMPLSLRQGVGIVRLSNTKSGIWTLSISPQKNEDRLLLPAPHVLTWSPGPATRLVIDGPAEYIAGHPIKVRVKAVDEFGNLAETYQGTVVLEVKAS